MDPRIAGCIAYAARQYLSATRDVTWLRDAQAPGRRTGFDLFLETARFWVSRATPRGDRAFDINGATLLPV